MSRYASVWAVAPDWAEWIATDADGIVYYYADEPKIGHAFFWAYGGLVVKAGQCDPTPDWRDSLERRPRSANPTLCPHCGKEI